MLMLLSTGYLRRSEAQKNMLKVYKAERDPRINGLHGLGGRVMRQIERNWKIKLYGISAEEYDDITASGNWFGPLDGITDKDAPPPRWHEVKGVQTMVEKIGADL